MYLPGLEMTLSFQLYSDREAERQMLFQHLDQLEADDLLVLDRGYPGPLAADCAARGQAIVSDFIGIE